MAVLEGLHFLLGELAILGRRNGVAQGTSCLGQGAKASKSPGKSEFWGYLLAVLLGDGSFYQFLMEESYQIPTVTLGCWMVFGGFKLCYFIVQSIGDHFATDG